MKCRRSSGSDATLFTCRKWLRIDRYGDISDRRGEPTRCALVAGRLVMQDHISDSRYTYQKEKERVERREFQLLLALIHKLKTAAAVLERI